MSEDLVIKLCDERAALQDVLYEQEKELMSALADRKALEAVNRSLIERNAALEAEVARLRETVGARDMRVCALENDQRRLTNDLAAWKAAYGFGNFGPQTPAEVEVFLEQRDHVNGRCAALKIAMGKKQRNKLLAALDQARTVIEGCLSGGLCSGSARKFAQEWLRAHPATATTEQTSVHITREGEPLCGASFAPGDVGFYARERVEINCAPCLAEAHRRWPEKWPATPAETPEQACERLGIDVAAWAEVRAKVAAATPAAGRPAEYPGEWLDCDANDLLEEE